MRRFILFTSFFIAFFAFLFPIKTSAQTDVSGQTEPAIVPAPQNSPIFGQDQYYSVVFRGNGEAVVNLRVALTNTGEGDLSKITLRVPNITVDQLLAYQVTRDPVCSSYGAYRIDPTTGLNTRECLKYTEPDYYSYYYGKSKYQKAEADFSADTITITLPKAIASDKSGSYILYFRSFGYAKKDIFGVYNFNFETLKVNDSIRNLQVGISTDADQVLKGTKGEVSYRSVVSLPQAGIGLAPAGGGIENTALDSYYRGIGRGSISKSASNLAPLESYKLAGSYAKSNLVLFLKPILVGVLVFLVVLALIGLGIKFLLRRLNKKQAVQEGAEDKETKHVDIRTALISAGVSFASAFVIAIYLVAIFYATISLSDLVSYQFSTLITLFIVIVSFAIFTLLLFAPAIYIGLRKSVGWGIATVVFTIIWLIIFVGIAIFVLFLLGPSNYTSPIYPLLDSVRGASSSTPVAE